MYMINFLASMAITVHDQTVSVLSNPFLLCDFRGYRKHTAQRHFMLGFNVIHGRDQNIGNNKDVRRRLGRNVAESRDQFILIDNIRRNFAADNFTEKKTTSARASGTVANYLHHSLRV